MIIDELSTYPEELKKLYISEKENFKMLKETNDGSYWYEWENVEKTIKPATDYFSKVEKIIEIINPSIKLFHVSKLFQYEKEDILKNGFSKTTKNMIYKKIEIAYHRGKISKEEMLVLKKYEASKEQNTKGLFYCYYSLKVLMQDNKDPMNFNIYWGGESISWHLVSAIKETNTEEIEKSTLEKIRSSGVLYYLVGEYRYLDMDKHQKEDIVKNIILTFIKDSNDFPEYNIHSTTNFNRIPIIKEIEELILKH